LEPNLALIDKPNVASTLKYYPRQVSQVPNV